MFKKSLEGLIGGLTYNYQPTPCCCSFVESDPSGNKEYEWTQVNNLFLWTNEFRQTAITVQINERPVSAAFVLRKLESFSHLADGIVPAAVVEHRTVHLKVPGSNPTELLFFSFPLNLN